MELQDVEALEDKLKSEHQKNMEAIRRVRKLLLRNGFIDRDSRSESSTLIKAVEDAIMNGNGREWTAAGMYQHLLDSGLQFSARNPQLSINTALARLRKRGVLEMVEESRGRRPAVYKKVVTAEEEPEPPDE